MPVEPVMTRIYEAYCDLHDDDDENSCDWLWCCEPYGDAGDCEIELCAHMLREHDVHRPLPFGYEYRQGDLDKKLGKIG